MYAKDTGRYKAGLKVELDAAADSPPQLVLSIARGRLPRVELRHENGEVETKVLSFVDLLAMLDGSTTIGRLEKTEARTVELPPLPAGTLLASLVEHPARRAVVVTGFLPPAEHAFLLEDSRTGGPPEARSYPVPLPHLVYRAVWQEKRLSSLSLALCSPELEGRPAAETRLYRYPFSNVYASFRGVMEGVCWMGLHALPVEDPREIPRRAVLGFLALPNNADLYGRGLSHNAPITGYAELLEACAGGLEAEWLIPAGCTVAGLHRGERDLQERRTDDEGGEAA